MGLVPQASNPPPNPAPTFEVFGDQGPRINQAPAEVFVQHDASQRNGIGEEAGERTPCVAIAGSTGGIRDEPFELENGHGRRVVMSVGAEAAAVENGPERYRLDSPPQEAAVGPCRSECGTNHPRAGWPGPHASGYSSSASRRSIN